MMQCHRDVSLNAAEVVTNFSQCQPRQMELITPGVTVYYHLSILYSLFKLKYNGVTHASCSYKSGMMETPFLARLPGVLNAA